MQATSPEPKLAALLHQAAIQRAAGDLPASLISLQQAARLAPNAAPIQHDLGRTLFDLQRIEKARLHFDRAVSIAPDFGAAHFFRGVVMDLLKRPGAATAYQQAIIAGYETQEVFSRLAALLHQAGRRTEAAPLYRHAASFAPDSFQGLMDAARAALIENNLDEAETLLRAALAVQPATAAARAHLAYILRARGDFTAAAAQLDQALRDNPTEIGLFDDLVQSGAGKTDATLLARMRAAPTKNAPPPQRIRLHLAMARTLDAQGDYESARQELQRADRLRAQNNPFNRAALSSQTGQIIALFSPTYMALPNHQGSASELPILVIGMPRSGTTLVEQILASHPNAAGAGELPFWESQGRAYLPAAPPDRGADLRAVADSYLATLSATAPTASRVVDKMPFNFRWAPLIHLALPNARIIHVNRHPADIALSILSNTMAASPTFSPVREDLLHFMRLHRRLLAHLRTILPRRNFLDLHYEDLVTNPEPNIRALLDFCGLAFNAACLTPETTRRDVLTFSQYQARQPITPTATARWRNYGDWLSDFAVLEAA